MIYRASTAHIRSSKQIGRKPREGETVTEMGCRNTGCISHMLHSLSIPSSVSFLFKLFFSFFFFFTYDELFTMTIYKGKFGNLEKQVLDQVQA